MRPASCVMARGRHCRKCRGSLSKPCNKCYASGNLSSYLAKKSSNRCDQCDTKGRIQCDECERGVETCAQCEATGHKLRKCPACGTKRVRRCTGCSQGAFKSWESAGDVLLASGDLTSARAYFEIARGRVDEHYAIRSRVALDRQATTKIDKPKRAADIARLCEKISATSKGK